MPLAGIGAVGLVALVWAGPYPVSMIGLDDAVVNNSYPTRVTLAFLGCCRRASVLRGAAARALDGATAGLGGRGAGEQPDHDALPLAPHGDGVGIGTSVLLGGFGLGVEPLGRGWWLTRPVWWLVGSVQ